jgi:hypothetical protein
LIGVEVFGRRPDYDQAEDPVVRIRAADVRKRIALFYGTPGKTTHAVKITIPSGSYKACFEFTPPNHGQALSQPQLPGQEIAHPIETSLDEPLTPSSRRFAFAMQLKSAWFLFPVVLFILAFSGYRIWRSAEVTSFERFWSPVMKSPTRPVVYVGSNAVYALSEAFLNRYRDEHHLSKEEAMGREFIVPLSPNEHVDAADLIPVQDTYVTIGDVAASTKITSFFAGRGKAFDMRYGGDISIGDLRERTAVLIGGFNNSWTLEMTDNLRFVFVYGYRIQDRFDKSRSWKAARDSAEEYAIVSRILNSKTGNVLVTVAGIGQAGTRAAGEFLTNPDAIDSLVRRAPRGWEKKNMQILLHTNIINGTPNAADVVDTYYW